MIAFPSIIIYTECAYRYIDVASKMKVSKNNSCGRPSYAEYRAIEKNLSKLHIIVLNERTESNRVIAVLSERKEFLIVKTKKMRQWL